MRWSNNRYWILILLLATFCPAFAQLDRVQNKLRQFPEYSIILEDMKEDGNFFKSYYHRYKVVYGEQNGKEALTYHSYITEWQRINQKEFQKYQDYLGMVLISKNQDGNKIESQYPPGYQYVGDSRYGQWRQDERGNSFWEFYGKYALLSQVFGMFRAPVYETDWQDYQRSRSRRQPYFGKNKEYGTNGTFTRQTHPSFFDRRQARDQARKTSFSQKVNRRVSRSNMSGMRRRSSGFGK